MHLKKLIKHFTPDFVDFNRFYDEVMEELDGADINADLSHEYNIDEEYPISEKMKCTTVHEFLDRVWNEAQRINDDQSQSFRKLEKWMICMVRSNMHLPFCKAVMDVDKENELGLCYDIHNRTFLMLIAAEYQQHKDEKDVGMTLGEIDAFYPSELSANNIRTSLWQGNNELFNKGYIFFKSTGEDSYDRSWYVITDKTKQLITV